jgi:hypothetical protein
MAMFVAPPARIGAHHHLLTDCNDRGTVDSTSGYRYINPCSSRGNYRSNFDPTSKKPQRVPADFRQDACDVTSRLPGSRARQRHSRYGVCRYCVAAVERLPWHTAAEDDFLGLQPHNSTSNNTNHFLTRLCGMCEEREIRLLNQRLGSNFALVPVAPSQAMQNKMEDFPHSMCTCKKAVLDTLHLCLAHRRQHYDSIIPLLNARRDANRTWLQSIERVNGKLVRRRGVAQIRDLTDRRTGVVGGGPILLRACRCGEDPIDDIRNARVLQCMCCEGIVHVTPVNPPQAHVPAAAIPRQLRQNSQTTPWKFRLRRQQ